MFLFYFILSNVVYEDILSLSLSHTLASILSLSFVTAGLCWDMRVNEKAFNGTTSYLMTAKHLRSVVGGAISGFSEFTPVCFPHREALFTLMRALLMGGIASF